MAIYYEDQDRNIVELMSATAATKTATEHLKTSLPMLAQFDPRS